MEDQATVRVTCLFLLYFLQQTHPTGSMVQININPSFLQNFKDCMNCPTISKSDNKAYCKILQKMVSECLFVLNPHCLSPSTVCLAKKYLPGSLSGISKINRHFGQAVYNNKLYANYILNSTNEKLRDTQGPQLEKVTSPVKILDPPDRNLGDKIRISMLDEDSNDGYENPEIQSNQNSFLIQIDLRELNSKSNKR